MRDVFVNDEALIFRRGAIRDESFALPFYAEPYATRRAQARFLVKNYALRRGALRVRSALWVIDNLSDNYYHWIVESLPRLLAAETAAPTARTLLLPERYQRLAYVRFTLRAFPNVADIEWIPSRSKARVDNLVFVPRQEQASLARQMPEIANRIAELAGDPGTTRRLYFTRGDAARRRVRNERDVIRVLRSHDFEIMRIDPTAPAEQVRATRGACEIVAVHGAELTNLVFLPPGGRVLELRHDHESFRYRDVYRPLAEAVGIDYRSQLCTLADADTVVPQGFHEINNGDLIVDLDVLRENVGRGG